VATSGSFTFQDAPLTLFIEEAYERLGVLPDNLTAQQIQAAGERSLNFLLTDWMNQGLNLWTVEQRLLALNPGQNTYALPQTVSEILEMNLRQSIRALGGTAQASSGNAAHAFDNNPHTACVQDAPNGWISYGWGQTMRMIQMVGVVSEVSRIYQLSCEVKQGEDWKPVLEILPQEFPPGQLLWFALPAPQQGTAFRIQETGGAILDIQELYFSFAVQDRMMTAISRSEWMAMPNKNQTGQPTCFYWDRTIKPTLSLWPTPTPLNKTLFFTCTRMMEDAGDLLNQIQIPSRFYEALASGLAWKLAVKYLPEKAPLLKSDYDAAFASASGEDTEDVPLRIGVDWQGGYTW
jgi:hypothetical protein